MLISNTAFMRLYKNEYERLLQKSKKYVNDPELLKKDIESKNSHESIVNGVPAPRADEFTYNMIRYRGFVNYPDRLKNFVIAKHQAKECEIKHLPVILDIEPVSRCNFRCIMCQVKNFDHFKRTDDLSFDHFKEFVESQYGLTEVKLQGMGEPLLSKHFFDMVKYLVDKHIWVRTTVNGSLLHVKENYKKLVESGINEVQTSFDGATKEVFEKIRVNSKFEKVVANLKLLNHYANSVDKLITRMWVLLQKYNSHQVNEFIELAKYMEFRRVTFSVGLGDWGQEKITSTNRKLQLDKALREKIVDTLLELRQREDIDITLWDLKDKYRTGEKDSVCGWPFTRAYISADMRIVPCCMIGNPDVADLGSAKDFMKLWNGQQFIAFRQMHLNGNIPKYCKNCYH